MSELTLNLIDAEGTLHGRIHGSVADAAMAALSAEPETIPELVAALARYIKPLDNLSPFAWFQSSPRIDAERWDAGIVIIDLTTRIIAAESSYSQPLHEGQVRYHDGTHSTDIPILFRLPDDWLFVNSVEAYQWSLLRRGKELTKTPLDVREILYGAPLLDFIVNECGKITAEAASDAGDSTPTAGEPISETRDSIEDRLWQELCAIHARWLMTPREDLRGDAPREVMLAKREFIDFDLHTRSLQWSLQNEGPPCLSQDSFAYRFAGFGTHEWVIYYDLVRHLLWSAIDNEVTETPEKSPTEAGTLNAHSRDTKHSVASEIARLEEIKSDWLSQPLRDYDGRIPAVLIENERKRLPIALRPRDMIIDEDCPTCQMFGDETSPLGMGVGFWHLDGSQMEDEFAFSWFRTREEWEAENHRREEFDREFNRKWEEREQRIARGEPLEPDPYFDPEPFDLGLDEADLPSNKSFDSDSPNADKDSSDPIQ